MRSCYRPPGLLVVASYYFPCNRANALRGPYSFFTGEERIWKERRRAGRGGPRPTDPPPWVGVGGAGGLVSTSRQICDCIRALIAGVRAASRFAVAYALRLWLGGFFLARWFLRLNIFHAIGLAPSGGHILSSPTKKEYGKKDAARVAGCSPPYEPTPLGGVRWRGWVCFGYQANLRVHPCPVSW